MAAPTLTVNPTRARDTSGARQRVSSGSRSLTNSTFRTGQYQNFRGRPRQIQVRTPSGMPARLNNTAAKAVASKRAFVIGQGASALVAPAATVGNIGALAIRQRNRTRLANGKKVGAGLQLKAQGYRASNVGTRSVVRVRPRTQARAQRKLAVKSTAGRRSGRVPNNTRRARRTRRDSRGRYAGSY